MPAVANYIDLERDIYNLIKSMSSNDTLGVKEYELKDALESLSQYPKADLQEALRELVRSGYILLNYPTGSFVGFYQVADNC